MASKDLLVLMARYKAWADQILYSALGEMPEHVLIEEREIVFGSVLRTLHHVYAMDDVWRAHLLGISHGYTTRRPKDCPDFRELRIMQRTIDDWYLDYVEGIADQQADDIVEFEFIGGGEGSMTRAEIVLHVVNHTTYHRGHIGDMIYASSLEPPTTDLPVFMRDADSA